MLYVSVIVLCYNQEDTVVRTLDSIVKQETSFSYEVIVADDDSKDNTRKLCEEYSRNCPCMKLLENHPNYGVVKNYNEALKQCKGKYLMVCAGDDWWHNTKKIDIQVSYMEQHPEIVVHYGGYLSYYPATGITQYVAPIHFKGELFEALLQKNFICAPTVCVRHDAMNNIHFERFVEMGFMVEDYPSYLGLSGEGDFGYTDEALVTYTIQYGSINNCYSFEKKKKYLDNVRVYKSFFARERSLYEKYSQLIDSSYYYWLAEYAVRYGERLKAYEGYKNVQPRSLKTRIKTLLCRFDFTFKYLNKKYNANLN